MPNRTLQDYEEFKPQVAHYPDLRNKRVLVTGGSAGIGKACAFAFSRNGCVLALAGRRLARLQAVVNELPSKAYAIAADLLVRADCERLVQEAVTQLGGLDIIVNNGANGSSEEPDTEPHRYEEAFQLHVSSVVTLVGAALPYLRESRGCVVNVSSILSVIPSVEDMSYCVAKAAQDSLTANWALKYAQDGIRINSVRPGIVITEVYETIAAQLGRSLEDLMNELSSCHALGRVSTPEEQASVILFLSSKSASFLTGATIRVDGGAELGFWYNGLELQNRTGPATH